MAGAIKGITIEFDAKTNKLDKAIKDINKQTRSLDAELKSVTKALKFNPTSLQLWKQKQELLTKKIGETENKLKLLKQQQANMDAAGIDKSSVEYMKLQREIIETESKLKSFKGELKSIGNVNMKTASEQFKALGTNLTKAGEAMKGFSAAGAAVVATLGALAYKSGQWADDLNTMSKVYGISTIELQKYAASANLVDVDIETIAASHRKLTKAMGSAQDGSKAQVEAFKALGISVTDANGELRDSDEVWQEVIAALGGLENETQRDAIAMDLLGKSAADLNPLIEDGGETYKKTAELFKKYNLDFIDQETLDRANEFNDSIDMIKAIGLMAFQQIGTQLASVLAPALEKVVGWVGRLAEWLGNLDPSVLTLIASIAGVVAVVSPLLIGLGKLSFAISSIITLVNTVGPAVSGALAAAGPVVLVIAGIVAAGVLLYKNWDVIKKKAQELWTKIKTTFTGIKTTITSIWNSIKSFLSSTWNTIKSRASSGFNAIKSAIVNPLKSARDTLRGIIDRIKGFFPIKVGKLLQNLKLPHFKLSGSFSLVPPKVPKISVDWYKTGGIFDSPTIYPIGIGEAGPEAVVPLDTLWKKLDRIAEATADGGNGVTINVYAPSGMDVNQLAAAVEQRLVRLQLQRQKAWQ